MCAEAIRCERTEERPTQVGSLGHDIDRAGEIPDAEADLTTLAAFQCLLEATALWSRSANRARNWGPTAGAK